MLFHPPTWKMNDTTNPIPPTVPHLPYWWMNLKQLKNWARPCFLLPLLADFIGKSENCKSDIYSRSAFGWRKKRSYSLCFSLLVSLNPLTVTLLDFRNLRPGVKMAACGESSHPCWLPQCWLLDRAKLADSCRYVNRTASQGQGSGHLSSAKTKGSGWCRNATSPEE